MEAPVASGNADFVRYDAPSEPPDFEPDFARSEADNTGGVAAAAMVSSKS